ncbi:hypothetical protein D9Q98_001218 [Chlorella vulgaris]|uniref:Cation-transporting P-type ATPase C-terminal domain-containing protein n=1 Tax=Chlorella vulgaris TaxID=3077 RepID=A0A9D4TZG6_CHLVU|nr:hypothetical protein D9Q98_001218 [Chlorella vulgaris]
MDAMSGFAAPALPPAIDTEVQEDYRQLTDHWESAETKAKEEISSMVFNTFIWCQMFNMLNARKVSNEHNVLSGPFATNVFWTIWVLIAGFQVCHHHVFLGGIFKVEHLSGLEWGISILIGLGSTPLCILSKAIPNFAVRNLRRRVSMSATIHAVTGPPSRLGSGSKSQRMARTLPLVRKD